MKSKIKVNKTKLRPVRDVLKRLIHDKDNFDTTEIVVGYKERFTNKVLERPLGTLERNVTSDFFLLEHRIVYFKIECEEDKLWDKNERIDNVFSGDVFYDEDKNI